ncbi:aspartyl-phosphate phosphatase Spo0E family protein [Neobacillus bataviensis]|uniref:aspartyl-phosphate phosphatase Spo0E family protein n=1 Tax=Neobacillus bataviensis TaxID=220685 RepID=UPI001CBE5EBF|nr:aspartyl-phosphate phosphatase Spo0E family protein [Neobacillus bataviensis]
MRLEHFEAAINEKKAEMIHLGMTKGLQDEETIYCSQELDKLLNDYNRLLLDDKNSKFINHYVDLPSILIQQLHRILSIHYRYFFIN